jgi:plasmid replication initiation protein
MTNDTNRLTIQSNKITLGRTNFSLMQKRIVLAIVESVSPHLKRSINKEPGREVSFQPLLYDDICKITYKASDLGVDKTNYDEIRNALETLTDKKLFIETKEMELSTRFVLKWKFEKRSSYFEVTIDRELFQFLLIDPKSGYTTFQTKVALSLGSIYASKIYELLAMWRNVDSFNITIAELRRLTDTQDKYLKYDNFKKRVLEVAKLQLEESSDTDLKFDYKELKKGENRLFKFFIYKTKNAHDSISAKSARENPPSLKWDFSDKFVAKIKAYGIEVRGKNYDLFVNLGKKMGEDVLLEEIERIHSYAQKNANPKAYLIKSLKNLLVMPEMIDFKASTGTIKEKSTDSIDDRKRIAENARKSEPVNISEILGGALKSFNI